jgi:hypothetical protein
MKTLGSWILVLVASGCGYSKHPIDVAEIRQLDGFDGKDEVVLIDAAGERFSFTGSSRLTVLPGYEGVREARFRSIRVSGTELRGISEDGAEHVVDLGKARRAYVENGMAYPSFLVGVARGINLAAKVAVIATIVLGVLVIYAYADQQEPKYGTAW